MFKNIARILLIYAVVLTSIPAIVHASSCAGYISSICDHSDYDFRTLVPEETWRHDNLLEASNPPLIALEELDLAASRIRAPIKQEALLTKYNAMSMQEESYSYQSSELCMALLENGTKVYIKKSKDLYGKRYYGLANAMCDVLASRLARAYFDMPTILPTDIIYTGDGEFEVRRYFMNGHYVTDLRDQITRDYLASLFTAPENFGRTSSFTDEISLFDDFFGFADRRLQDFIVIPAEESGTTDLFYAFNYDLSFYNYESGLVLIKGKGERFYEHVKFSVIDLQTSIEDLLDDMIDDSTSARNLVNYLKLSATNGLRLDVLFCFLWLLKDSSLWEAGLAQQFVEECKVYNEGALIDKLIAITNLDMPKAISVHRLKQLNRYGLPFSQLFRHAARLQKYTSFQDLLNEIPDMLNEKTVDAIISYYQNRSISLVDRPSAPLSAIRKLDYLSKVFGRFVSDLKTPEYYEVAKKKYHAFIENEGPLGPFYIMAMGNWQANLLRFYVGRTYDNGNFALQVCLYSNKVTQRLFASEEDAEVLTPMYSTFLQQSVVSWKFV